MGLIPSRCVQIDKSGFFHPRYGIIQIDPARRPADRRRDCGAVGVGDDQLELREFRVAGAELAVMVRIEHIAQRCMSEVAVGSHCVKSISFC